MAIQWSVILAGLKSKMSSIDCMVQHPSASPKCWFVYLLRCADDTLYTGICTAVERRVGEHNAGPLGARYTRARRPVVLVYCEAAANRSEALRREREIKRRDRAWKLALIAAGEAIAAEP